MFMPEKNRFPAQLGMMIGKDYQVILNGMEVGLNVPIVIAGYVLKSMNNGIFSENTLCLTEWIF